VEFEVMWSLIRWVWLRIRIWRIEREIEREAEALRVRRIIAWMAKQVEETKDE
jgi:hypothetical protein